MWILRNLCFHTPFTHARRTHPSLPESTFIQLPLFQPFTFVPNYCKTRLTFTHSHWIHHTGSFCECLSNSVKCSAISGAQKTPSPLQKGNLAYRLWPLVESCLSWERHRHWLWSTLPYKHIVRSDFIVPQTCSSPGHQLQPVMVSKAFAFLCSNK